MIISNNDESCYFCDEETTETHHIVPQRHGGSDADENLVEVCPTCHRKLESMYDKRFFTELGVSGDPLLNKYNSNYKQIEVTPPEKEGIPSEQRSFEMRMDANDHFQFYCPECSHPARIEKLLVHNKKKEICFFYIARFAGCMVSGKCIQTRIGSYLITSIGLSEWGTSTKVVLDFEVT